MNCIIPFSKDIKFKTNICEILSISLEHDYTLNDSELLGNFIVSGNYKSHEVSINKEKFELVLPFSVTLTAAIEPDTLDFNIEDFTYEIIDNNTLKVDIEYSVKGDELEREEPIVFEKLESEDDIIENLLEEFNEESEEMEEKEEIREVKEEPIIEIEDNELEVEIKEEIRDVTEEEKETIINEINSSDNTFVTYHIHILKENENIETVCTMYNTNTSIISEYNDITNISIGDKIIIPDIDE